MNSHGSLPPRRVALALLAAAAATLATAALLSRPDGRTHLTVLDTGGGTAVLIRDATGLTALIGGGGDPQHLLEALGRRLSPLQRRIDAVVVAGGAHATIGGLSGLAAHYAIGSVLVLVVPPAPAVTGLAAEFAAAGAAVSPASAATLSPGLTVTALRTPAARSPALLVTATGGRALLLGDLTSVEQEELAAVTPRDALRADLVVGPASGVAGALLAAVSPHNIALSGARSTTAWPRAQIRLTGDGDLDYVATATGFAPP